MHPALRKILLFSFFVLTATASSPAQPSVPKCPTYIDTVVPSGQTERYGKREPGDPFLPTMHDVHNTLSNCSTIKSLKLRVTGLGCSEWPDRFNFPFDLTRSSRYPSQLEALDLEGYDFNQKPWDEVADLSRSFGSTVDKYGTWVASGRAWTWLKGLSLSRERKNMTNLDLWLEAMDFSRIEKLSLTQGMSHVPDLARLVPHLTALKSLAVREAWAKDLILALPEDSLTHLSWLFSEETGSSVEPILRRQAASLKSLEWREPENGYRQRRVMSAEQVAALGSMAPNLRKLTLDVNQNGTLPWDHLEALATKFPKLVNATVFLEMASECRRQLETSLEGNMGYDRRMAERETDCVGPKSYSEPGLTFSNAKRMFEFLAKKNAGGELKRVSFYAGDWERPWDGALADAGWIEGKQDWAICWVEEGGDSGSTDSVGNSDGRVMVCQMSHRKNSRPIKSNGAWYDIYEGEDYDEVGWRALQEES